MRAASYTTVKTVTLVETPQPEPGPGDVLIQVGACGICGSDLHRYRAGGLGGSCTPGHEIAGRIARLGNGVSGWDAGAPVAIEPLVTCRSCPACLRGDYQICPRRLLLGVGADGGLAEFVRVPAYGLFALPPDLPLDTGALAEPVAVAVHGVRLARVARGDRVLVQGSGVIGLLTALVAAEAGATVTATARYPHQAEAAARFGAGRVFPTDAAGTRELDALAAVEPFDIVIETVGGESDTLIHAPRLARPGGTICVLGVFLNPTPLGALGVVVKEQHVVGAITYGRSAGVADFELAIALLSRHRDLAGSLITHRRTLDQIVDAYALADDKSSKALKVTVLPG